MEFKTREIPTISFEVPKSRISTMLSKKKYRTFYLSKPDPLTDLRICSHRSTGRIIRGEEDSKTELAQVLALALIKQHFLFVPGLIWVFSRYLAAKLDLVTLMSLAKIAIMFSSYSALLEPFPSKMDLFLITGQFSAR